MASIQQGLRGRTVYGNGSYAPNRGQVSAAGAQGYLRREVAKKNNSVRQGPYSQQPVGRDGKSDRRSGVAAGMVKKPPKTKAQGVKAGTVKGGSEPKRSVTKVSKTPAPVAPAAPPPQVTIGPTGTLSLPTNQQFSDEVLSALGEYNSGLLGLQQEDQQAELDYQQGVQQQTDNYVGQQRNTLNDAAARGVVSSSGYSQAVGRDAAENQQTLNSLSQGRNSVISGNSAERTNIQTMFNQMLQNAARGNAESQVPTASNLAPKPKPKPKAKPKPKPKAVADHKKKKK